MANKKIDEEKIAELQVLEQNAQNLLLQKQAFQLELNETENALKEIEHNDEVYKMVGNLMFRAEKKELQEQLKNKKEILALRLQSIDKQEKETTEHLKKTREEVLKQLGK